jgi:hypothetical protein
VRLDTAYHCTMSPTSLLSRSAAAAQAKRLTANPALFRRATSVLTSNSSQYLSQSIRPLSISALSLVGSEKSARSVYSSGYHKHCPSHGHGQVASARWFSSGSYPSHIVVGLPSLSPVSAMRQDVLICVIAMLSMYCDMVYH